MNVKFRYTLSPSSVALEQLCGATLFTKLDFRSANNLILIRGNCSLHQSSVQFLGYHISEHSIQMEEGKVDAIPNWPLPIMIKEVQLFLGFTNFYRHFIKDFSSIVSPFTNLLKGRPKSLSWPPAATQAFEKLKDTFTTAPLLIHPDPSKPFIVQVEASTTRVGAVLSQQHGDLARLHSCAYPQWREIMTSATVSYLP